MDSATEITKDMVHEACSSYYENKGLTNSEFTYRLQAINLMVFAGFNYAGAIFQIMTKEGLLYGEKAFTDRYKVKLRNEIKAVFKVMGYKRLRDGSFEKL